MILARNIKETVRIWSKRKLDWRTVRFWWQRRTRGFDDSVTWSLDCSLAKWLLPRFKRYRVCGGNDLAPGEMDRDKWRAILDDIEFWIDMTANEGIFRMEHGSDEARRFRRGRKLFGKWVHALWT